MHCGAVVCHVWLYTHVCTHNPSTWQDPAQPANLAATILNIQAGRPRALPPDVSAECRRVIEGLLHPDPHARTKLEDLARDAWLLPAASAHARLLGSALGPDFAPENPAWILPSTGSGGGGSGGAAAGGSGGGAGGSSSPAGGRGNECTYHTTNEPLQAASQEEEQKQQQQQHQHRCHPATESQSIINPSITPHTLVYQNYVVQCPVQLQPAQLRAAVLDALPSRAGSEQGSLSRHAKDKAAAADQLTTPVLTSESDRTTTASGGVTSDTTGDFMDVDEAAAVRLYAKGCELDTACGGGGTTTPGTADDGDGGGGGGDFDEASASSGVAGSSGSSRRRVLTWLPGFMRRCM